MNDQTGLTVDQPLLIVKPKDREMNFQLVLTATGGRVHASADGRKTLCSLKVDPHRGTSFWGSSPDCLRCRKVWKNAGQS